MTNLYFEIPYDTTVPGPMWLDENLEPASIKLYAFIRCLSRSYGYCFATNDYLSNLMKCDPSSVRRYLGMLKKEGYIDIQVNKKGIHWERRLVISDRFKKCLRKLTDEHPPAHKLAPPCSQMSTIKEEKENIGKEEKEREEKENPSLAPFFIYGNVKMPQKSHDDLVLRYGEQAISDYVQRLDDYKGINEKKFKTYSDHAAVLRTWIKRDNIRPIGPSAKSEIRPIEKNNIFKDEIEDPNLTKIKNSINFAESQLCSYRKMQREGTLVMKEEYIHFPQIECMIYYDDDLFKDKLINAMRKLKLEIKNL